MRIAAREAARAANEAAGYAAQIANLPKGALHGDGVTVVVLAGFCFLRCTQKSAPAGCA